MKAMNFYAEAMKTAISHVVKLSSAYHIHSVRWTHHGFNGEERYLDVLIETTNIEGEADEKWEIRVRYANNVCFYIGEKDIYVTKL